MRYEIDVDVCPGYPVSWQAAALNAVMRGTLKPISGLLLRADVGVVAASRLFGLAGRMRLPLPDHVSVGQEQVGTCSGEWVRAGRGLDGGADRELDESRVLLYFHGGGYFFCSPATHRPITWRLSAAAGCPVLAVDYRQCPAHTLAESLEDAIAAYLFLLERGYDPARILFAGDSAGGHLTLVTLLALRGRGLPLPAAAVCLSPWTDLTDVSRRANRLVDPLIPAGRVDWLARRWTACLDPRDPLVSPVFGDYSGLPPLMIVTGSTEVLRDEGRRVAERARAGGVPVTYEEWRRMPHVFAILADLVPEARRVFWHIARFLGAVRELSAGNAPAREPAAPDLSAESVPERSDAGAVAAGKPPARSGSAAA
ncbi:acetyl esterase/lipase [Streptosporangium album]|uniref:Acetyl esterase/lipase n=1 Tax=Streptosporangium album TaxID=47479 RepID=A0A7W7S4Q6_9ACTN|nr:alpha/beta hydrolase [Streptosporangium album]MBB4943863.1 acetyl esterase/lipase [Streptosporangium album]